MQNLIQMTKAAAGECLLSRAIRLLPLDNSARLGVVRGLREQRRYDRYAAYTQLLGVRPFDFEKWREVEHTLRVKCASAH